MATTKLNSDKPITDREPIFQLVNQKEWQKLIDIFKNNDNYSFISNDPILKPLIDQYFIDELLSKSSMDKDPAFKYYLQTFFILHQGDKYAFVLSETNFKKLIVKIVEVEKELARAYDYALHFPEAEVCRQTIEKFKERQPKFVEHSQEFELIVTENKNISDIDSSIGYSNQFKNINFTKQFVKFFKCSLFSQMLP